MGIEFKEAGPEEKVTEHIFFDGMVIGEMVTYKGRGLGSPYHAIFSARGNPCTHLLQGYGQTKEEAIRNALVSGRSDATAILKAVEELETKLSLK